MDSVGYRKENLIPSSDCMFSNFISLLSNQTLVWMECFLNSISLNSTTKNVLIIILIQYLLTLFQLSIDANHTHLVTKSYMSVPEWFDEYIYKLNFSLSINRLNRGRICLSAHLKMTTDLYMFYPCIFQLRVAGSKKK